MIFCTKKYFAIIILILLIGGLNKGYAQARIQSPEIRCVSVDSSGGVTLTWTIPPKLDASFLDYHVFAGPAPTGPYAGPFINNPAQTSCYLSAPSAQIHPAYYIIYTDTVGGSSAILDTVSSISLSVTNATGVNSLKWNSMHTPMLPTSTDVYNIYREGPQYVWKLIGSVRDTNPVIIFNDTVYFCHQITSTYKVEIADSSGCISSSNRDTITSPGEIYDPAVAIDTLSVTPGNSIDLTWEKSRDSNIEGYIIYQYYVIGGSGVWLPIDTVWGINNTSLISFTQGPHPLYDPAIGSPDDSALSFEVAALDSCLVPGVISNSQTTLFLKDMPDKCAHNNTLRWNSYVNLVGSDGGYRVYVSINGGPYGILATTASNVTTYIDSNLNQIETRCYYVQVYDSLHHDTTASSNRLCYNVLAPKQPIHDYLGSASVVFNSSEVNIFAYMDTLSGAGQYEYQRAPDSLGDYTTISTIPAPHTGSDSIFYIDNSVNPAKQSYRYRIITLDSCGHPMDTSNLGQTVYLAAVGLPNGDNILQWNDYHAWAGGPQYYLIYRSEDGATWTEINQTNYSPLANGYYSYTDDARNITIGQGIFYYYIRAIENPTGAYPFTDTSLSNIAEAYQDPLVFIPDAFNPRGVNKIFKPVGVFIDVTGYDFVIINRWGIKVFESTDPTIGWDGTHNGGSKPVEEDVYVYLLTYTSSRGEYFQRKGTVTLLK